ncbi:SRPBCC domain-containing protein [Paenibacillus sp. GCM10023250]|uniref:SRPBCC domain-containing protein n=1 Tax=Paenibacillus sp. GCM10023250 TaxID=3252648 RepID=UPI003610793B
MEEMKFELYIGAKPEDVWRALVSPEGTKAVYCGSVLESTFEPGSPYAYIGPGNDGDRTVHVYGTIVDYEANKRMSYMDHPGPSYHDNHEALETRVTLTLEPVGETVKLTLVNDLWPEGHPSYEKTKSSWPMILSSVKTFAETGKALDFGL